MSSIAISVNAQEPYILLSDGGETMTFYYDNEKNSRNGIDINDHFMNHNPPYGSAKTAIFDNSFANYEPKSTAYWFLDCFELTTLKGLENLKTDNVTDMGYMFYGCSSLKELDLSPLKTDKVENMKCMFFGCTNISNLDLSGFKTGSVKSMDQMFRNCISLSQINISNFDTYNVTNMDLMFYNCQSLKSIDLHSFKTDNVTEIGYMFCECFSLERLDLSGFKTDNVSDMAGLFKDCSNLTTIYVGNDWNTSNVIYGTIVFQNCTKLVGEKGTNYSDDLTSYIYARIDGGPSAPGYFSSLDSSNIKSTQYNNNKKRSVYSISGQKLENLKKGINIVDGKKIILK